MVGRFFIYVMALVFGYIALGCGAGAPKTPKKPTTESEGEVTEPGAEPFYPGSAVTDAEDIPQSDQSTGDVIPSGEGEKVKPPHVMSRNAKGTYKDGVNAGQSGNLAQAEKAFQRVLKIDSQAYQAAYNLGVVSERKGDDERAKSYYRQAFRMQPDYVPAIKAYANLEIRKGKIRDALDLVRAKAHSFPKNKGIQNCYSNVLIDTRRYKDAIKVAKRVLRLDELNAEAMLRIGKANLRLGRFELAESVFNQVIKINPDEAEVYFLRASIRLDEKRKAAAVDDFKTAIQKRPNYIEAMNNLATMYILSGNYDLAIEQLQKAVSLSPSWGILQLNYGNALRGAGRWKEAKQALKRAQALDSRLNGAIFNLALLYYVAKELDGMDRLTRIKEAKRLFAQYKSAMGSDLSRNDQVFKYLKEVDVAAEREERRIQREADRKTREAERAKEREAKAAKAASEDKGKETDKKEEDEWEEDDEWED